MSGDGRFLSGGVLDGYQTTPIVEGSTLTRLTYEQRLLNGRLDLEVGKSNVHQHFFIPNTLDPFTYDTPLLNVNADFNSIPYALWMGKATYKLTKACTCSRRSSRTTTSRR